MRNAWGVAWIFFTVLGLSGCNRGSSSAGDPVHPSFTEGCSISPGSPWAPLLPEEAKAGADPSTQVSVSTSILQLPATGTGEVPKEVEVEVPMPEDLGSRGSLSLVAERIGLSEGVQGGAYPILTSLDDGNVEWVNLISNRISDQPGGCSDPGLFCCATGRCRANPDWKIASPSAFKNWQHWEQYQLNPFGDLSVTTFPTCRWTQPSPDRAEEGSCFFDDPKYFSSSRLRFGHPYRARYALLLEGYRHAPTAAKGSVRLTVLRKKSEGRARGSLVLNLVLVGSHNVSASHTPKGRQNLDALLSHILNRFSVPQTGIGVSAVRVFEWDCRNGGEAFAEVNLNQLGKLFSTGSRLLPAETETHALNLFIVSNILGANSGFTVLGASGAVGGPLLRGTEASGLVFSSFNRLDQFNISCSAAGGDCPLVNQERSFAEMGETIAHEMGHFLGLNHLSESEGKRQDTLPDTPECRTPEVLSRGTYITQRSCRLLDTETHFPPTGRNCLEVCPVYDGKIHFCPEAVECNFNHLMWWTSKNFNAGQGDGSLISEDSWAMIRFSPAVQ